MWHKTALEIFILNKITVTYYLTFPFYWQEKHNKQLLQLYEYV